MLLNKMYCDIYINYFILYIYIMIKILQCKNNINYHYLLLFFEPFFLPLCFGFLPNYVLIVFLARYPFPYNL